MGLLAALRPGISPADLTASAALIGGPLSGIKSPWAATPSHLQSIVWSDIFGAAVPRPLTRAEAMRLPEVKRARNIVCGTIARIPLRDYRGTETTALTAEQGAAPWLEQTDGAMSPFHRMLMTLDDQFFYGWSLWRRTANDSTGRLPLRTERIPMGEWELEADTGRVLIYKPDGQGGVTLQPAHTNEVILLPGPHEGILVDGQDSLRHARDLHTAAGNAARFPTAYLGLRQTSGDPLKRRSDNPDDVTVETILADWKAARLNPDGGGVAWLGGVEPVEIGTFAEHLMVEGRNAAAVDIARHASLPADLLDATMTNSSLQYTTSRDNDRRAIDYGLGFYMSALSGRLTQDDVTPHGRRIAFDLEEWLQGDATAPGQPAPTRAPGLAPGATPTSGETPQ